MKLHIFSVLISLLLVRNSMQLIIDETDDYNGFVANITNQYEQLMESMDRPKNNYTGKYLPPIGNSIEDGKVVLNVSLWYQVGDINYEVKHI